MKTLSRFVAKFTSLIVAVLSCFDRVLFKGYLPLTNDTEGIDDPRSRYYNQLVNRSKVARGDWRTFERMLEAT